MWCEAIVCYLLRNEHEENVYFSKQTEIKKEKTLFRLFRKASVKI
jgi:hypothetical protein